MAQLKPTCGKRIDDAATVAAAIGLAPEMVRLKTDATTEEKAAATTERDSGTVRGVRLRPDLVPAGQEVNCGSTFFIVPLATRKAVDAAILDRAKVDAMLAAAGIQRRGIYVFSTERGQDDATAYSRLLGSGGIADPATGSAAGPAGCFAAKYGMVPADRAGAIVFLQGVLVRRPSRIHVKVAMSGGEITGVKVGGSAVVVGEGTMLP
jgi:trans-2,3-dihydro-3-hydroxyanthranilate isomerase